MEEKELGIELPTLGCVCVCVEGVVERAILAPKSSRSEGKKCPKWVGAGGLWRGGTTGAMAAGGGRSRPRGRVETHISGHFRVLLQRRRGEGGCVRKARGELGFHPQRFHSPPGGAPHAGGGAARPCSWHGFAHARRPGPAPPVLPPAARPAPFCRLGAARPGLAGRPFCEASGGRGGSCSTAGGRHARPRRRAGA